MTGSCGRSLWPPSRNSTRPRRQPGEARRGRRAPPTSRLLCLGTTQFLRRLLPLLPLRLHRSLRRFFARPGRRFWPRIGSSLLAQEVEQQQQRRRERPPLLPPRLLPRLRLRPRASPRSVSPGAPAPPAPAGEEERATKLILLLASSPRRPFRGTSTSSASSIEPAGTSSAFFLARQTQGRTQLWSSRSPLQQRQPRGRKELEREERGPRGREVGLDRRR